MRDFWRRFARTYGTASGCAVVFGRGRAPEPVVDRGPVGILRRLFNKNAHGVRAVQFMERLVENVRVGGVILRRGKEKGDVGASGFLRAITATGSLPKDAARAASFSSGTISSLVCGA